MPDEGELPAFDGATGWLNSAPLTAADLRGRVVLIDFWTYTCINWLRTLPYVDAWAERYDRHGLVVIGVHTPEFDVERDVGNVRRAVEELGVGYPVAIDNDYAVWTAFHNRYWPAVYLADAEGRIRYHHFGEGEYDSTETILQRLLTEAGAEGPRPRPRCGRRGRRGCRGRLGQPVVPGELPRLRPHPGTGRRPAPARGLATPRSDAGGRRPLFGNVHMERSNGRVRGHRTVGGHDPYPLSL